MLQLVALGQDMSAMGKKNGVGTVVVCRGWQSAAEGDKLSEICLSPPWFLQDKEGNVFQENKDGSCRLAAKLEREAGVVVSMHKVLVWECLFCMAAARCHGTVR
jgi:hypothetical protein